jgi:hypothetical protein
MFKKILMVFIVILFVGCGDSEDRVVEESKTNATVNINLNKGETRTLALKLDIKDSYLVESKSVENKNYVNYRVDYENRLYPEVIITGVNEGNETIKIEAIDASGDKKIGYINATVINNVDSSIDKASGNPSGGTTITPGSEGGGAGGSSGSSGNSVPNPSFDPDACLDNNVNWGTVEDIWSTTEGVFSDDNFVFLRSQIPSGDSLVRLYYYKKDISPASYELYTFLGRYSVLSNDGKELEFDVQVLNELLGKSNYFYIKLRGNCYRAVMPTSPTSVDKTLTPVFSSSMF